MGATKKKITKIAFVVALILSLVVFILEATGTVSYLRDKMLLTYDYFGQHKLRFVDVADGNCAIIQSDDKTAIINFGGVDDGGNAVLKAIRKYRITTVDYAFITIVDSNHLGGFMAVSELVDINKVIIPKFEDFEGENILAAEAVKEKIINELDYEIVELNKNYTVGEFTVTAFYYQPSVLLPEGRAVLYKVAAFNNSAVIGGSFHKDIMYELLATNANIKTDIFLLPGFSDNAYWNLPFFNSLNAKCLISSSSYKNDSIVQEDFEFLKGRFKLYRTDVNGDITFYFNEKGLSVLTER